jgi:hypothetical protein
MAGLEKEGLKKEELTKLEVPMPHLPEQEKKEKPKETVIATQNIVSPERNTTQEGITTPEKITIPKPQFENVKPQEEKTNQDKTSKDNISKDKKKKAIIISSAIIVLIILALFTILYSNQDVLTGSVISTLQNHEMVNYSTIFTQNTQTQLEINNLTSLRINGVLEGTRATVKLRINGTDYTVGEIINPQNSGNSSATGMTADQSQPQYTITTDKTSYSIGETVYITITPTNENSSIYISYEDQTNRLENNTYIPTTTGEYQAIALIVIPNDILRITTNFTVTEQNIPTTDIINETNTTANETPTEPIAEQNNTYTFNNICTETCNIPENNNPTLIIELEGNSKLTISDLIITQNKENHAPEQTKTINDITIQKEQEITLNLNDYFKDIDRDNITYDINQITEINTNITQNELKISSTNPGTYLAYIYATDGDKLTTSNTFTITITETTTTTNNKTNNTTNETSNSTNISTTNENNITINTTTNQTSTNITTENTTTEQCSNPDPNQRPLICTQGINSTYFKPEEILINNKQGIPVARFTPIGNLLIKGEVIEQSAGAPSQEDYQLGYLNDNGDYTPTIWIDSATGSLHLKGNLIEANGNIPISDGLSALANQRGIILALFNRQTGGMTIRGNVIPYRRDVTQ